jgi:hypothetical protein
MATGGSTRETALEPTWIDEIEGEIGVEDHMASPIVADGNGRVDPIKT